MQGLADGYFVLPYTIGEYLSTQISRDPITTEMPEFDEAGNVVESAADGAMAMKN